MSILYIQLFAASSNPMMEMVSSDTSMEEDNIDISTLQPSFDTVDLEEPSCDMLELKPIDNKVRMEFDTEDQRPIMIHCDIYINLKNDIL